MQLSDAQATRPPADPWRAMAAFSAALLGLMLLWAISGDPRQVEGVAVWIKPAKFSLSLMILFATIALVVDRLSPAVRSGWTLRLIGWAMGAAMIAEMVWIIRQAALGVGSHFNLATPLEAFMYETVMAGGAVILVLGVGLVGLVAYRDRAADLSPALREAIWLGFLASFVLTMIVALRMGGGGGHHVGIHPEGAPSWPFLGWSGVTGDLRPAHFLSLHAMQALPLFALWLERRGSSRAVLKVRLAAVAWSLLTLLIFAQALAGLPLIRL
ncbi:MAG: hypothetical protein AAFY02_07640 [Pseudomonadota bacterium]